MQKSNLKNKKTGFTLIETIVAITILITAIMGPMALASKSIGSAIESKNKIVAFYLAQEAIEYVRSKRDNNSFAGAGNWLAGLNTCTGGNGCWVDIPNDNIGPCGANCQLIMYDDGGDYYNYSQGDDTIFTRIVRITSIVSGVEAKLEAEISWNSNLGITKSFILEEHIFNWK